MGLIVITAGHSNTDPGAVNGSHREAEIACEMRNIIAHILRSDYGLTVKTDGTGNQNLPLRDAVKLVRGSALAVEIHCNAAANKRATGIEALALSRHKAVCQAICTAAAEASGWKLRGDKGYKPDNAGQHRRLAYAQAGGIVFEPFFISNDKDLAWYKENTWKLCRAVAGAIAKAAA
ncbi:N-acetylmuramoyl-L-alanine amidase [Bergeriella denitrificans]|uniref:N-acetylmuramoyl-L-alanine amidase n=1 Tax=Bergeriella denitrificans TaxID=494 RepID=A0A378UGR5_BERDE|nr:N-acetylmuramoyl-L-alanine amidase [Bergeriella denitrificans]STZ76320.1 N-acetylmuramoyl-L-alanine amidase [Bergeriella denitrificans]